MMMGASWEVVSRGVGTVIAIPANNEADRIEACLAALSMQRDDCGGPVRPGSFEILVFANNCCDATIDRVLAFDRITPHPVRVVAETLPHAHANAGWARKRAMDLAAARLIELGRSDGAILTTDADSCVAPTWYAATMAGFAAGADCVAGYIDAHPLEMIRLGADFLMRGRLEDRYLRAAAEIYALCDPRAHDPWPNHRVSSGASLAVTLAAYLSIGGLPPRPVGEDAALTQALERAGFRVRHAMDVSVMTSCRFDGRAKGGAADTMEYRHAVADALCDDDLEPALFLVRRALYRGLLRRLSTMGALARHDWHKRLLLTEPQRVKCLAVVERQSFLDFWEAIERESPVLCDKRVLRPADLPRQIARAEAMLTSLRGRMPAAQACRSDRSEHVAPAAA